MIVRKITLAAVGCVAALLLMQPLLLTSCSSDRDSAKSANASGIALGVKSSQSSQTSQSSQPDFGASVVQQARLNNSSTGRVALAMLICRLDSSYVYSDLIKKNAKELFDIVSETAVEKNVTLESLNSQYGLCDILASEKIYVSIESNNVTALPQSSTSSSLSSSALSSRISKETHASVPTQSAVTVSSSAQSSSNASPKESSSKSSGATSSNATAWVDKFQKAILQQTVN